MNLNKAIKIAGVMVLGWMGQMSLFAEGEAHVAMKKDLVILSEQEVKNLKLETQEAEETDFEQSIFALGRIEVFPGNLTVVSSRISGRAFSVLVKADTEVEEGAELMWVESRQPGNPPPSVALEAPASGMITKVNTAVGKPISPEDSLIEIVNLDTVHAVARVPEYHAHLLKAGLAAKVKVAGYPDRVFEATLAHVGALADAETGTLEAAFHVPNPEKILRPGMRAEFSITVNERPGVLSVPRSAVQGEGAQRWVYVADFDLKHAYEKVPVEVGEQNEERVEILSGVFPGDLVVTRGAYALMSAGKGSVSLKEAMDAAHGHAHAEDGSELTEDAHAGHDHAPGEGHATSSWNGLTLFFAGLSALLFVLLILSSFMRKR